MPRADAHNTLHQALRHYSNAGDNHRHSMSQPNKPIYARDWTELRSSVPTTYAPDPGTTRSNVPLMTGTSALSLAPSANSSHSDQTNPRPLLAIGPNARDLAAIKREMSRSMSFEPGEDAEVTGTRCLGPLRIRKIPAAVSRAASVNRYKFQFVFEENVGPLNFIYSTSDDLVGAIEDFIVEFDLDLGLLTPIRLVVEAELGEAHQVGWYLSVEATPSGPVHPAATMSGIPQIPSNLPQPVRNSPDWIHYRTMHNDNNFYHAQYTPLTRAFQLTYGHTLRTLDDCPPVLESLCGRGGHKFMTTDFLKLAFAAVFPNLTESVFAQAAAKLASATLVTVARMLHIGATNCPCDADDFFDQEEFQIEVWKRLNIVLPPLRHLKPQLHHLRVRYVFALLESAISAMEQSLERLIPELRKDRRSRKAVQCIMLSLDVVSGNHKDFVGHWAWEELLSQVDTGARPSLNLSFSGRPGNQDPGKASPSGPSLDTGSSIGKGNSKPHENVQAGQKENSIRVSETETETLDDLECPTSVAEGPAMPHHLARDDGRNAVNCSSKRHISCQSIPPHQKKRITEHTSSSHVPKRRRADRDVNDEHGDEDRE